TTKRCWSCAYIRSCLKRSACQKNYSERYLGKAIRGHQQLRRISDAQRRGDSEVFPAPFERRTEEALSGAPRNAREKLEILTGGCERARVLEGLPKSLRGNDPEHGHKTCAVVRDSRGQQMVHAFGGSGGDNRGIELVGPPISRS